MSTTTDKQIARTRSLEKIKALSPLETEIAMAWLSGYAPDAVERAIAFVEGLRS